MSNLRNLPSIDEVLGTALVSEIASQVARSLVVAECREAVAELRRQMCTSKEDVSRTQLLEAAAKLTAEGVEKALQGTLYPVINGTGVVLHTNLGRAVMGKRALSMLEQAASSYVNLEIDMATGDRGSRYQHVEDLLCRLTGAEAALVVNNNAAAVMLALNTIAAGGEGVVSRGQLVEIGGAFRIPEVMKVSGARLAEVGTTNKTYIKDFEAAINEDTRVLMWVHTSNYKIVGFTEQPSLEELVRAGNDHYLPVMVDLGSGILADLSSGGLSGELTVQDCISAGADIITASGDKILGGPQAGIILGKRQYIETMKKNQLTRALRVDKLIIAALEGTLIEYLAGDPYKELPVLKMLTLTPAELKKKAQRLRDVIKRAFKTNQISCPLEIINVSDRVGGGAYPVEELPGYGVAIRIGAPQVETLAARLRGRRPGVLLRIREDALVVHVRTLLSGEEGVLAQALAEEISSIERE
ncbi:MAG: L-seryl-tRNA(Sec) selenium transferase [Methylocystaceae bacterium]